MSFTRSPHAGAPIRTGPAYKLLLELTALIEIPLFVIAGLFWCLFGRRGGDQPIIVIPGFGFGNRSTALLRFFLRLKGYRALPWVNALNSGLDNTLVSALVEQASALHRESGKSVMLIGWSLGGIYARIVANTTGSTIKQVITLGSPFNAGAIEEIPTYVQKALSRKNLAPLSQGDLESFADSFQVRPTCPTTAVFSYSDPVVTEHLSLDVASDEHENIGIIGSHVGLTHNPLMLCIIADRLQQTVRTWQPFRAPLLSAGLIRVVPHCASAMCIVAITLSSALIAPDMAHATSNTTPEHSGEVQYSPYAERAYPVRVYWGDSHVHTRLSFDAGILGVKLGPDEAYRFATGETVTSTLGQRVALSKPLDWLAVTDHSDGLDLLDTLGSADSSLTADPLIAQWVNEFKESGQLSMPTLIDLSQRVLSGNLPSRLRAEPIASRGWEKILQAAERANRPGVFTSLIGFEWTPTVYGNNLHRNVIFRDGAEKARKVVPYTVADSADPMGLWAWMEGYEAQTGGDILAIPHNGNLSNGTMFPIKEREYGDEPLDENYALARARWEPLYEVTQIKGDGETHPLLSPTDEFADFERWDQFNLFEQPKKDDMIAQEYAREALKNGLSLESRLGVNPYKFGMLGSTDSHTGLATAEENNFFGKNTLSEPQALRPSKRLTPNPEQHVTYAAYSASGYAGVWATDNTRESIFDALRRKEVYATTGPRIMLRFFGGWNFDATDFDGHDSARKGYEKGVPMGSDLPRLSDKGSSTPSFLVWAIRDPDGAKLDRVQIVKGWLDTSGATHEKVYDILCSDGRPIEHDRCTSDIKTQVDVQNASWKDGSGATELRTVWSDKGFDPGMPAFYYVRVLQVPTPRWTLYDASRYGEDSAQASPASIRERAYSSPIWFTPEEN